MRALLMALALLGTWPAHAGGGKPAAEWTFLVYLNGNNNLDSWGVDNLLQMEKVGSTDRVNVVVEWGSMERKRVQRFLVTRGADPAHLTSPVLEDLGPADMGDWHTLADFLKWGIARFPAQHYFVDVWDHGTGWHDRKRRADTAVHANDISHDEISGHWITTPELAQALAVGAQAAGHKLELYASDACLMGMIEIATEVSDSVAYYGGSVMDIPARGWPYDTLLAGWNALPDASPAEVGRLLTKVYLDQYAPEPHKEGATFSVFDLSRTGPLLDAVAALGRELGAVEAASVPTVKNAMIEALDYTMDYTDLLDFLDQLDAARVPSISAESLRAVREAATAYVVAAVATPHWQRAHGISIWMPGYVKWYNLYLGRYQQLRFSRATHWEQGLTRYLSPKRRVVVD